MNGTVTSLLRRLPAPVRLALAVLWWLHVTLWLGIVGLARLLGAVLRIRRLLQTSTRCPRGHRVELFGTFRCPRCKAAREGHAFDPCPHCGARASYLECERCGLAVRSPAR